MGIGLFVWCCMIECSSSGKGVDEDLFLARDLGSPGRAGSGWGEPPKSLASDCLFASPQEQEAGPSRGTQALGLGAMGGLEGAAGGLREQYPHRARWCGHAGGVKHPCIMGDAAPLPAWPCATSRHGTDPWALWSWELGSPGLPGPWDPEPWWAVVCVWDGDVGSGCCAWPLGI